MDTSKKQRPAGKLILGAAAGLTAIGGFLADWNRTHLFNPDWTPHAKFHDAWSITLGTMLGGAGLYFLFRRRTDPGQATALAAALPAFFWGAQGISFAYPGTAGLEAEFPELVPRIKGVWINELFASAAMLTLIGTGFALEQRRQKQLSPVR